MKGPGEDWRPPGVWPNLKKRSDMGERTCRNCDERITKVLTGRGNYVRWCSDECRTEGLERTRSEREARRKPCRISGCATLARNASTDLCEKHYYEICRRDGKGRHPKRSTRRTCEIDGCSSPDIGLHRLCAVHYSTRPVSVVDLRQSWWGGTTVSYATAHSRVRQTKGRVSSYQCVDCGDQANNWSYDYNDPDEAMFKGAPYGVNPSYYSPRCIACHAMSDKEMNLAIGKRDRRSANRSVA